MLQNSHGSLLLSRVPSHSSYLPSSSLPAIDTNDVIFTCKASGSSPIHSQISTTTTSQSSLLPCINTFPYRNHVETILTTLTSTFPIRRTTLAQRQQRLPHPREHRHIANLQTRRPILSNPRSHLSVSKPRQSLKDEYKSLSTRNTRSTIPPKHTRPTITLKYKSIRTRRRRRISTK